MTNELMTNEPMNQKNISMVVAISENNAIGKNNQLLWHLPADLKHFKAITSGHSIIMGRKTYESIGKPLPNRRNIVISRQELQLEGVEVVHSIADALSRCETENETFIIGGAEIYKHCLEFTNQIFLTTVHSTFEGDAFFPILDPHNWQEINKEHHLPDEKNAHAYTFSTLIRK